MGLLIGRTMIGTIGGGRRMARTADGRPRAYVSIV
jgi:hypothetical protein